MKNRIDRKFIELREKGEKALVGFVTAGDPSFETSLEVIKGLCDSGIDVLELGVPFSDPTADGPVIQRSSGRALQAGMSLHRVLELAHETRQHSDIPIVVFSYYNPILAYGPERFYRDALAGGADGALIVDLPPEESDELTSAWPGEEMSLIRLLAPTTPPNRMEEIARAASGFLYLVSMTGVTGSGGLNMEEATRTTSTVKSLCNGTPICVGFGISTPDQVRTLGAIADGVVVGSAFERLIESNLGHHALAGKVADLARDLKMATIPGVERQGIFSS